MAGRVLIGSPDGHMQSDEEVACCSIPMLLTIMLKDRMTRCIMVLKRMLIKGLDVAAAVTN